LGVSSAVVEESLGVLVRIQTDVLELQMARD